MAVAEITNLVIEKGEDFESKFTIYNENGSKFGFTTSFSGISKLRKYPTSPKEYPFAVGLNTSDSSVVISMGSTMTSQLPSGRCCYDILLIGQDLKTKKYVTGTIIVRDTSSL